jgi:N-acetylmuramoyl-L-alanine amidase
MRVALVIGHNKHNVGACNDSFEVCEYEFNKHLSYLIENYLEENYSDITVDRVFRKTTYYNLPNEINELEPDIIVSLHCNAFNNEVSGTETLYHYSSEKGKKLAYELQKGIVDVLELPDRGIKPTNFNDRGGFLLSKTKAVCVIIEPFFIDNDDDYLVAKSMERQLAEAIGKKINKYKEMMEV